MDPMGAWSMSSESVIGGIRRLDMVCMCRAGREVGKLRHTGTLVLHKLIWDLVPRHPNLDCLPGRGNVVRIALAGHGWVDIGQQSSN